MDRSRFIKSFITLLAAPSIITALPAKSTIDTVKILHPKKSYWFKVSREMMNDGPMMEKAITAQLPFIVKGCSNKGIDLSKKFIFRVGNSQDDFCQNLVTCVIEQ